MRKYWQIRRKEHQIHFKNVSYRVYCRQAQFDICSVKLTNNVAHPKRTNVTRTDWCCYFEQDWVKILHALSATHEFMPQLGLEVWWCHHKVRFMVYGSLMWELPVFQGGTNEIQSVTPYHTQTRVLILIFIKNDPNRVSGLSSSVITSRFGN